MKLSRLQMLENCIVRGGLVAGAAAMPQSRLLAAWEEGEPTGAHTDALGSARPVF